MPLYIDSREPEDLIQQLRKYHLDVQVKTLESGDIVFGDVAIERKTVTDLITSVTSGDRHLWKQLETMKNTYKQPILLIEGEIDFMDKLLMGILTTVILFWKYQTIFTKNKIETAIWIERLFIKYGIGKTGRIPPAAVKKHKEIKDIQLEMLQCIEGIGPIKARKILINNPNLFKIDIQIIKGRGKGKREGNVNELY